MKPTAPAVVRISDSPGIQSSKSPEHRSTTEMIAPGANTSLPAESGDSTMSSIGSSPAILARPHFLRLEKKLVGKTYRGLRPVSKKREALMKIYRREVAEFKAQNPICCYCHKRKTTDNHHERGRIGPLLMDKRYWRACCRRCHDEQPAHARSKGPRQCL
jgi:hypothetical protein